VKHLNEDCQKLLEKFKLAVGFIMSGNVFHRGRPVRSPPSQISGLQSPLRAEVSTGTNGSKKQRWPRKWPLIQHLRGPFSLERRARDSQTAFPERYCLFHFRQQCALRGKCLGRGRNDHERSGILTNSQTD
jgi:hypothetical protein